MARCGRAGSRAAARRVPRNRPAVSRTSSAAIGDRAYSSAANRACLRKRGIKAVIPVKEDQKTHRRNRGRHGGRALAFGRGQYKDRDTAGRCFGKLKRFRAVATRYDKREFMYQGTIDLASIRIWLRDPVP
jgi:transposase